MPLAFRSQYFLQNPIRSYALFPIISLVVFFSFNLTGTPTTEMHSCTNRSDPCCPRVHNQRYMSAPERGAFHGHPSRINAQYQLHRTYLLLTTEKKTQTYTFRLGPRSCLFMTRPTSLGEHGHSSSLNERLIFGVDLVRPLWLAAIECLSLCLSCRIASQSRLICLKSRSTEE